LGDRSAIAPQEVLGQRLLIDLAPGFALATSQLLGFLEEVVRDRDRRFHTVSMTSGDASSTARVDSIVAGGSGRLGAADEAAGELAGGLAVVLHHATGDDRGAITVGLLDEAPASGGEVVDHLGRTKTEGVEV